MEEKRITELVFILDKSGSMGEIRDATIENFNGLLDSQRKEVYDDEAKVSFFSFNHSCETIRFRAPIETVEPLTCETYAPYGSTALNDAVCSAILEITKAQSEDLEKGRTVRTLVCIITDGRENMSRRYSRSDVRRMIERKKADGWDFVFAGANINVEEEGADLGFAREDCLAFEANEAGIHELAEQVSYCCASVRVERGDEDDFRRMLRERRNTIQKGDRK